MKEYEVTFWTEPTKYCSGREEKRVFKARNRSEAIEDAEDKYPNWSVTGIRFIHWESDRVPGGRYWEPGWEDANEGYEDPEEYEIEVDEELPFN